MGSTTTITTTTTTTKKSTTSANKPVGCEEIHLNSQCDWDMSLIDWYEDVMTGAECQEICRNVHGSTSFSHYNEGHEAERGFCGCFSTCAWPSTYNCHDRCATHEVFSEEESDQIGDKTEELNSAELFGGEVDVDPKEDSRPPGPRWCHCMRGPLQPDVDACDLWP